MLGAVDLPVLAAGGIGSARGVAAAMAAGAAGVRAGTRIAAAESAAHPHYKQALVEARSEDTVLTRSFSVGDTVEATGRALRSSLAAAHELEREQAGEVLLGDQRIPAPRFSSLLPTEGSSGAVEAMALYAGQSVGCIEAVEPAADIVAERSGLQPAPAVTMEGAVRTRHPGGLLERVYWLTANLATDAPLAIVVDDLHWADSASVRFLAYVARRVSELHALLVAASRPPVESHAPELIDALGADPAVRRLEPRPLSHDAVADLIERELGTPPAPELVRDCHAVTGGNPFLVHSVATALAERGLEPTAERRGGCRRWAARPSRARSAGA